MCHWRHKQSIIDFEEPTIPYLHNGRPISTSWRIICKGTIIVLKKVSWKQWRKSSIIGISEDCYNILRQTDWLWKSPIMVLLKCIRIKGKMMRMVRWQRLLIERRAWRRVSRKMVLCPSVECGCWFEPTRSGWSKEICEEQGIPCSYDKSGDFFRSDAVREFCCWFSIIVSKRASSYSEFMQSSYSQSKIHWYFWKAHERKELLRRWRT